MGTNSIVGTTFESLRPVLGSGIATTLLVGAGLLAAAALVPVFRKRGPWVGLAWSARVAYLAIGRPFLFLAGVPPYGSMRSTLWFLTINLPLLLSLLAALFLDRIDLSNARAGRALVAFAVLAWLDLWPYLWIPTGIAPVTEESYLAVGRHLDQDLDSFRYAWVPFTPSRGEEAYADRFTVKRNFGGWLLWCSGKWGGRAVARGFEDLRDATEQARRADPRAGPEVRKALRYFALCDVKYFLVYRDRERFRPLFGNGLTPVGTAGDLLIARNDFWEAGRAVRFPADPAGRLEALDRADEETIEARFTGSGPVFVSEAYHPYWKAELDGHSVPVEPMLGSFIGLRAKVPGPHVLRLHFETPWYYRASAVVSLASLLIVAAGFASLRRRTRGGASTDMTCACPERHAVGEIPAARSATAPPRRSSGMLRRSRDPSASARWGVETGIHASTR